MKVPPKRKGNHNAGNGNHGAMALNESPSEKEGKYSRTGQQQGQTPSLNESPSEKEGKSCALRVSTVNFVSSLNESPSEKEGKFQTSS